jgi:muramoyltetrapeptide carboxypeptidase
VRKNPAFFVLEWAWLTSTPQIVKPAALCRGDKVGIIAPAGPIERELLERGCDALRAMGYQPVCNESILNAELYFAGSVERRVRELEEMFAREDVRAVLCARGGYGCNYLLPRIDIGLIRRNPKVFVGYSDVTTLLTWLHDAAGLVTFHGPMLTKDFAVPQGVDLASWQAALGGGKWSSPALLPVVQGEAQGKLYGGCLSLLAASLGTPYEIKTEGTILFIEEIDEKPYRVDRMLMQLKLAGKLSNVRGIVFGAMQDCHPLPDAGYTLVNVIRRVVGDLGVPVAYGLNSGHVACGNVTLPVGVQVSLAVNADVAELDILESAVVMGS